MARTLDRFLQYVGPDDVQVDDASDRWPAKLTVQTDAGPVPIDLFLGEVGKASRPSREHIERRIQNPGQNMPIVETPGRVPMLIGLWDKDEPSPKSPVLTLADARKRLERKTRWSAFFRLEDLRLADKQGWASGYSGDDEPLHYARPELFPALVTLASNPLSTTMDAQAVARLVEAAGLTDPNPTSGAIERARRSVSTLVRDRKFALGLSDVYDGECAMCGLDFGLVEGAHILPASSPGSSDELSNGIALCSNHHRAFDKHLIYVDPETRAIRIHPKIHKQAATNAAAAAFIAGTLPALNKPNEASASPDQRMFEKRYALDPDRYAWAV